MFTKARFCGDRSVRDVLLEALETELGNAQVYSTAVECAIDEDLREDWEEHLERSQQHVSVLRAVLAGAQIEEDEETPGRAFVKRLDQTLVRTMVQAKNTADPAAAELVASECVVLAEISAADARRARAEVL
jgi:hypothetical protein